MAYKIPVGARNFDMLSRRVDTFLALPVPPRLEIRSMETLARSLNIQVELRSMVNQRIVSTSALVDCGATALFASRKFIKQYSIKMFPL